MDEPTMVPVAIITIVRAMTNGDVLDYVNAEDNSGAVLDLSTALGMMRLAEDTLIRERMDG